MNKNVKEFNTLVGNLLEIKVPVYDAVNPEYRLNWIMYNSNTDEVEYQIVDTLVTGMTQESERIVQAKTTAYTELLNVCILKLMEKDIHIVDAEDKDFHITEIYKQNGKLYFRCNRVGIECMNTPQEEFVQTITVFSQEAYHRCMGKTAFNTDPEHWSSLLDNRTIEEMMEQGYMWEKDWTKEVIV